MRVDLPCASQESTIIARSKPILCWTSISELLRALELSQDLRWPPIHERLALDYRKVPRPELVPVRVREQRRALAPGFSGCQDRCVVESAHRNPGVHGFRAPKHAQGHRYDDLGRGYILEGTRVEV